MTKRGNRLVLTCAGGAALAIMASANRVANLGAGPSPLHVESFDTPSGTDLTWVGTWTNPDYTAAPAPLVGTESGFAGSNARFMMGGQTYPELWVSFVFHWPGDSTGDVVFHFVNSGGSALARLQTTSTANQVWLVIIGGTNGATKQLAANTTYYALFHMVSGSVGSNLHEFWVNTDGDFSGASDSSGTDAPFDHEGGGFQFRATDNGTIVDDIRWGETKESVLP